MRKVLLLLLVIGLAAVVCTGAAGAEEDTSSNNENTNPDLSTSDGDTEEDLSDGNGSTGSGNNTSDTNESGDTVISGGSSPSVPVMSGFTASSNTGQAPFVVTLTASASNATTYYWNFGDGKSDSGSLTTISHTYESPGNYTATVIAGNSAGNSSVLSRTITVTDATANLPTVSITANVTSGSAPLTVKFERDTSNAVSYKWDFGDGFSTSDTSDESVIHTYSKAGTFTANLTVENSAGVAKSATRTITVTGSTDVTLETNVTSGSAPLSVRFKAVTDLSVTSSAGFRWDVHPDESYKYGQTLNYTYEKEGTYTVTLRVTPDSGSSIDKTVTIKVGASSSSDELSAVFSSSTTKDTVPFTVTFTDKSTGNISEWKWTFGDDTKTYTSKTNPTYTFTTAGNYRVKLVVTDTDSKTSETYATIIAMEKSTATPTATAKALTSAVTETPAAEADLVPNPLDIVDEFLRLLLAMLNPANYAI